MFTVYLLVVCHLVSDFLLQFSPIATKKRGLNKYMLTHALLSGLFFFLPLIFFPFSFEKILTASLLGVIIHLAIDVAKVEVNIKFKINPNQDLFWALLGIDQILHVTTVFLLFEKIVIS